MNRVFYLYCAFLSYKELVSCAPLSENRITKSAVVDYHDKSRFLADSSQDIEGFYQYMEDDGSWEDDENSKSSYFVPDYKYYADVDKSEEWNQTADLHAISQPLDYSKAELTTETQKLIFDLRRLDYEDEEVFGIHPNLVRSLLG